MLRDFASPLTPQEIGVNPQPRVPPVTEPIVNDFSIMVATKNGSGSQTANLALLRALFRMGIPVSGKNVFPSNIQGRPTCTSSASAKTATSLAATSTRSSSR